MPLFEFWKTNREAVSRLKLETIIGLAGEKGVLKDGGDTAHEWRTYLQAVVLMAAVTSSLAQAQIAEPVLGIQLGQLFKIVQCSGRRDNWCSTNDLRYYGANNRIWSLMPPDDDSPTALPTWVRREKLVLESRSDGVVEKFYVNTLGPSVQDRVVESISGRFGKPTTYEKRTMQNAMGATVEAVSAIWKTADAVISHTCSQINSCTVFFFTAEAHAAEMVRMEQRKLRDKL